MTTNTVDVDPRFEEVLREAATWRLLGRLFEVPSDTWNLEIDALACELGDAHLSAVVNSARDTATEGDYHSIFGPGGPAPPREATYYESLELGSLMSDLAGYYDAFGYRPLINESPDHVAVELGFVAFLKLKEAYALAEGNDEHAAVAREAATKFVADHVAVISTPLTSALRHSPIEYLAGAAEILASRVGARPGPKRLPMLSLSPDDEEGGEFECAAP